MKRILLGAVIALLIVFAISYWQNSASERSEILESSSLIEERIKNVGKLIVTEGSFSQVYTYKDSRQFYLDVFSAQKKALIIVNAKVTVAYDLSKLEVNIDPKSKTVLIEHIPEEEISINPDIEYYDITQDYLNKFEAEDYNKIKEYVEESLEEKIANSSLISNAQNRLISELQKIYILTSSMGWTLKYKNEELGSEEELEELVL